MNDSCLILSIIIDLISFLIIFICSIIYLASTTLSISFFREMNENFKGIPIYSLNSNCNNPLVLGYWAGTRAGCDCRGIYDRYISHPNKFTIGACGYNETRAKCINYDSRDSINFIKYEGFSFCINEGKNVFEYKYYLENSVSKNEECANGFKSCGYLDTLDQKLCIKINEECPINDLIINKEEEGPKDYITIPLKHNKYLHYTNKNNKNHIITKLKLNEHNQPCIEPGEYNWKYYYFLEQSSSNCKTSIKSKIYDSRYIEIDSINKYELYYDNGVLNSIQHLPLYDTQILRNDIIYLYKRTFLGINKICMEKNKYSFEYFINLKEKQSNTKYYIQLNLIILGIIIFTTILLLAIAVIAGNTQILKIFFFIGILFISIFTHTDNVSLAVLMVLTIIHIVLFIFNLKSLINLVGIDIKFNCGDSITNALIRELKKVIGKNITINVVMIVCSSIAILFLIGIVFIEISKKIGECRFKKQWNSDFKNGLVSEKNKEDDLEIVYKPNNVSNENCETSKAHVTSILTSVNDNNINNQNNIYTPFSGQYNPNNGNNNENLNNNNL